MNPFITEFLNTLIIVMKNFTGGGEGKGNFKSREQRCASCPWPFRETSEGFSDPKSIFHNRLPLLVGNSKRKISQSFSQSCAVFNVLTFEIITN